MDKYLADVRRQAALRALTREEGFDVVVIGGGATGLGVALDAALRGLQVALVERGDFAQGTSSRSTKLVHGGVRYLAQGDFKLVYEALRERGSLLANAPHLAQPLSFVMPAYRWWQLPFYGAGLKAYDLLAGRSGLGGTRWISASRVRDLLPTVKTQGLLGGVSYRDGQFDDARLAIALARTAVRHGAVIANYCEVKTLVRDGQRLVGAKVVDQETRQDFTVRARCIINATGVWAGELMAGDQKGGGAALVAPSQGVHLSFDRALLPSDHALFWPRTSDGRVLFAIPWLGKTVVGTTDTPRADLPREPRPLAGEIDYLLRECAGFFARPPQREDIRSVWVGLRPLVNPQASGGGLETKSISREHTVLVNPDGLVTVTGGKWTTYRAVAQDVLDRCRDAGLIRPPKSCVTANTPLLGADTSSQPVSLTMPVGLHGYGSEAAAVAALPGADRMLAPGLSEAAVRFAVREELARTVGDVLARRSRLLFLDATAARDAADAVAEVLRSETRAHPGLEAFRELAAQYLPEPG